MERSYPQYGLYYYHEGYAVLDSVCVLAKVCVCVCVCSVAMGDSAPLRLSGVPALFIPGNGGSHKQCE